MMKICNIVTTLHACAVITAKQKSALAGAQTADKPSFQK